MQGRAGGEEFLEITFPDYLASAESARRQGGEGIGGGGCDPGWRFSDIGLPEGYLACSAREPAPELRREG